MTSDQKQTDRVTRLLAKVALGSRQAPGGFRLISGEGDDAVAALLTEIDETVLARQLDFRLDDDTRFTCVARSGRLVQMQAPAPKRNLGQLTALFGEPLDTNDPDTIENLHQLFLTLLEDADGLAVRSTPLTDDSSHSQIGFSAAGLATAWGIDLDAEPATLSLLDVFLSSCSGLAEAWLRVVGGVVIGSDGSADAQARLTALVEGSPETEGAGAMSLCTIVGRQDQGGAIVRAEHDGEVLFLLIKSTDISVIAGYWQNSIG